MCSHRCVDTHVALCYFRTIFCEKLTGSFSPSCNFVVQGLRGMEKKHIKNPKAINQTVNQTSLFHCGTLCWSETKAPRRRGQDVHSRFTLKTTQFKHLWHASRPNHHRREVIWFLNARYFGPITEDSVCGQLAVRWCLEKPEQKLENNYNNNMILVY